MCQRVHDAIMCMYVEEEVKSDEAFDDDSSNEATASGGHGRGAGVPLIYMILGRHPEHRGSDILVCFDFRHFL